MLWISDPKALQYIYQTSGYNFPKQPERRILSRLIGDTGLTWAEGAFAFDVRRAAPRRSGDTCRHSKCNLSRSRPT